MNGFFITDRQELFDLGPQIPPRLRTDTIAVWTILKARARWVPGYYQGTYLEVGQALFGREELANQLGISVKRVRTIVQHLKNLQKVAIKTTTNGSVATIINYNTYNSDQNENGQQNGQQWASNGPAMGQQWATNNKENKENKENNPPLPPAEISPPAEVNGKVFLTQNGSQPALRTDAELLDYPEAYDHQAVYDHYLRMKERYHRTRFLDVQVDRALRVLVRDPDVVPRLTQADMLSLVEKWMQWGSPWHAEDLWREDPKRHCPWWETLVHTGNHKPKFEVAPEEELSLDDYIRREKSNAARK